MKWKDWVFLMILTQVTFWGMGDCIGHQKLDDRLDRIERTLEDVRYDDDRR